MSVTIDVIDALSENEVDAVAHLVERVTETDGVRPLSENVTMNLLAARADGFRHICASRDGRLVAYASLELGATGGGTVEIAVDPAVRDSGVSGALLDLALRETSGHLDM